MTWLILPALAIALTLSGLFIGLRNRSPYTGVTIDDSAKSQRRVSQLLILLGAVAYIADVLVRQRH